MLEKVKKEMKQKNENRLLSPREMEIIKLIMQEFSSGQIAEQLLISKSTVDTHRKNILKKTKIKTQIGLFKFAFRNQLL